MEWKFTVVGVNVVLKLSCLHQPCCLSAALNVSCLKKSSWSQSKFAVVVVVVVVIVVIVCALVCGRGLVGRICILCLCYIHIHITCIYVCIYRYIHTHTTHTHTRGQEQEREGGRKRVRERERERETATAAQNSPVESERSFSSPPAQTGLECIFHAHVFRKKCRLAFASDEFATSHKIFTEIIV